MSTKVYEGFILSDEWNDGKIETFEKFCNEVKAIIEKMYNKEYCLSNKKCYINYELDKLLGRMTDLKEPYEACRELNPIPEITFFFFEGKVYGSTFNDNYGIRKTLIEKGYVKDFAYWDNTDPDEEVSEEEWNERQRVWDSIDHWQVSIQWQDYLMRSGFYLNEDEVKELKETYKTIEETAFRRWLRYELTNYITTDVMKKNNIDNTPYDVLCVHHNSKDLVDEVLKDDYEGEYLEKRQELENVIKKYKELKEVKE